jgi:hypothetical protein
MSINDYKGEGAVFITIERDKESSVESMERRAGQTAKQALKEWEEGMRIINNLKGTETYSLTFVDLVNDTERILKGICSFLEIDYLERMLEGPKFNFVYPQDSIVKRES